MPSGPAAPTATMKLCGPEPEKAASNGFVNFRMDLPLARVTDACNCFVNWCEIDEKRCTLCAKLMTTLHSHRIIEPSQRQLISTERPVWPSKALSHRTSLSSRPHTFRTRSKQIQTPGFETSIKRGINLARSVMGLWSCVSYSGV
jgi:hypothetical protein